MNNGAKQTVSWKIEFLRDRAGPGDQIQFRHDQMSGTLLNLDLPEDVGFLFTRCSNCPRCCGSSSWGRSSNQPSQVTSAGLHHRLRFDSTPPQDAEQKKFLTQEGNQRVSCYFVYNCMDFVDPVPRRAWSLNQDKALSLEKLLLGTGRRTQFIPADCSRRHTPPPHTAEGKLWPPPLSLHFEPDLDSGNPTSGFSHSVNI
ncbi:unnamed protein product [Pleuronectes platessa]|uniref:Uncharacterized protein n=1 Tax=Pleuronectes platessa TaxID=8262 RepID=A0A9N7TN28_PLEPL|nr:unnamed protein product [Pleuronectes platessa]